MRKLSKVSAVLLALILAVGLFAATIAASADLETVGPGPGPCPTYQVSYVGNGSTAGSQSDSTAYQSWQTATVKGPGTLVKTGYTFSGWNTAANGSGTSYAVGSTIDFITGVIHHNGYWHDGHWHDGWDETTYGDKTLYAQWTINSYTITFDSQGGSSVASVTQNYNTTVAQPANPTRTGYTFAGWYTGAGGTGSAVVFPYTLTGNVTVYAKWTINSYTMTFDSQGGSAVASVTQNYNTTVAQPSNPTKEGYTFAGWYSGAGGTGSAVAFPYTLTANVTVYAKWTINNYTMMFNSEGGTNVSPITQPYNTNIAAPVAPTRYGFTFDGWYTGALGTGSSISFPYTIKHDITVHAKWLANKYTLSFDSKGGSAVGSLSAYFGEYVNAPANPTRDGYTFDGWYLGDNATGGKAVFPYNIVGNATVYANWIKIVVVSAASLPTVSSTPTAPSVTSTTTISSTPTPTSVPKMGGEANAPVAAAIVLSVLLGSGVAVLSVKKIRAEK